LIRQALAFKILDIILLISLRIGREQTRIEMEKLLKTYFNSFSIVRASLIAASTATKPVIIAGNQSNGESNEKNYNNQTIPRQNSVQGQNSLSNNNYLSRGAFKARASLAFASLSQQNQQQQQQHHRQQSITRDSSFLLSGGSENFESTALSDNSISKESSNEEELTNSFEEYLKLSYDQSTDQIIGSSLKKSQLNGTKRSSISVQPSSYKYRSQSFGLLSLTNNEGRNFKKIKFIYLF
jgi:hypothetical protein